VRGGCAREWAAQEKWVEAIGRACAEQDICFLCELLVYPLTGDAGQTRGYVEHAAKTAPAVIESVRRFADPRFGVDVFKLESPISAPALPAPGSDGADAEHARALFAELGKAAGRPWVMLSAGASMAQFERVLEYAYAAGASGYLAGRAIWLEAARYVPDWDAFERALEAEAVPYMRRLNAVTAAHAADWRKRAPSART
jgi:tagatose 1,6-diphosphate aldolase